MEEVIYVQTTLDVANAQRRSRSNKTFIKNKLQDNIFAVVYCDKYTKQPRSLKYPLVWLYFNNPDDIQQIGRMTHTIPV